MLYLISARVMPSYGHYHLQPFSLEEARLVLSKGDFVPMIGYQETCLLISQLLGIEISPKRGLISFEDGDQAVIVRLKTRLSDPSKKGSELSLSSEDLVWEFVRFKK